MELKDAIKLIDGLGEKKTKETWADLGCGSGLFTYALAQHLLASFPLKHVQITAWKEIAAHAPTDIAVRVNMAAGESWHMSTPRSFEDDRYND